LNGGDKNTFKDDHKAEKVNQQAVTKKPQRKLKTFMTSLIFGRRVFSPLPSRQEKLRKSSSQKEATEFRLSVIDVSDNELDPEIFRNFTTRSQSYEHKLPVHDRWKLSVPEPVYNNPNVNRKTISFAAKNQTQTILKSPVREIRIDQDKVDTNRAFYMKNLKRKDFGGLQRRWSLNGYDAEFILENERERTNPTTRIKST